MVAEQELGSQPSSQALSPFPSNEEWRESLGTRLLLLQAQEHFRLSEQFQDCHRSKKKYLHGQGKVRKFLDLGKIHLIF